MPWSVLCVCQVLVGGEPCVPVIKPTNVTKVFAFDLPFLCASLPMPVASRVVLCLLPACRMAAVRFDACHCCAAALVRRPPNSFLLSCTQVVCTLPAGTGTHVPISLSSKDQLSNVVRLLSFKAPLITDIT